MLIFGQRHASAVLAEQARHDNGRRPRTSRQLHPPEPDYPAADRTEPIQRRPVPGGLSSGYEQAA
jgi:putative transposase